MASASQSSIQLQPLPLIRQMPLRYDNYPEDTGEDMPLFALWADRSKDYHELLRHNRDWLAGDYTSNEARTYGRWDDLFKAGFQETQARFSNNLGPNGSNVTFRSSPQFAYQQAYYTGDTSDGSGDSDVQNVRASLGKIDLAFQTGRKRWDAQGEPDLPLYDNGNVVLIIESKVPSGNDVPGHLFVDPTIAKDADKQIRMRANSSPASGVPALILVSTIGPFIRPYFWTSQMAEGVVNLKADWNNRSAGWIRPSNTNHPYSRKGNLPSELPNTAHWVDIRSGEGKRLLQRIWLDALRLGEGYGPPDDVAEQIYGVIAFRASQRGAALDVETPAPSSHDEADSSYHGRKPPKTVPSDRHLRSSGPVQEPLEELPSRLAKGKQREVIPDNAAVDEAESLIGNLSIEELVDEGNEASEERDTPKRRKDGKKPAEG